MIEKKILSFIQHHALFVQGSTIIVGLSGGPDSVFLLIMLHQLSAEHALTLIAVHVNHEWRANAHEDAQFCQEMATRLQIPIIIAKRTELACSMRTNGSRQEVGRKIRRFVFESVAREHTASAIALAHHADDQQETFFMRMLRGAALTGLTGIKPKQGMYIRPLLEIHKADIIAYLHEHAIDYITDPSNATDLYLRNRIRHKVVPALRASDPRFDQNFMHTIARLQETELFLDTLARETLAKSCTAQPYGTALDTRAFCMQDPTLQQRMILLWLIDHQVPFTPSTRLCNELLRFLSNPAGGTHSIHPTWAIEKKRGIACIVRT